jgi:flagellar biosynthesis protein FliR
MAQFGGETMDVQTGLSSAATYDPSSKGTINLIRRLVFYMAMIAYLMMNGHHVLIKAVVKSFDIVPLTGVRFSDTLVTELIRLTGQVLYVGVQIALPVVAALFMIQIALGIMAKVAPQMNVFMLSFPLNILVGLSIMTSSMPIFYQRLKPLFEQNFNDIITALQQIIPLAL